MAATRSYYMLISSLPHLPATFDVGRVPISWPTLRDRLRMLAPEDSQVTAQIGLYFLWDRQPIDRTDEEVIQRYHELMHASGNPLVRHLIRSRTEMRLLISAVRRQQKGLGPPAWAGRVAGLEALTAHVRKHWNQPNFNLGPSHRWVEAFTRQYEAGDVLEAQRVVFTERYTDWTRISEKYTFSFEWIIAYLVRWEIIDRWTSRDAISGEARFHHLIEETLGEYADSR